MRRILFLVSFLLFGLSKSNAQPIDSIRTILKNADSIILVSYDFIQEPDEAERESGDSIAPGFFNNGKLNERFFLERIKLDSFHIDTLSTILQRPFTDEFVNQPRCFVPHHAIFIFNKDKISYLDLCFTCFAYLPSKELGFLGPFDIIKWVDLVYYFYRAGFRLGMDELVEM